MTRKPSYRYLPSRHVPKAGGYLALRQKPSRDGRRLAGMTYTQSNAYRRIAKLYEEVNKTLGYYTVADNAVRIAKIERLIEQHFAGDWAVILGRYATREVAV